MPQLCLTYIYTVGYQYHIYHTKTKQSKHREYFYVKVDGYNESISKIKIYCDKNANKYHLCFPMFGIGVSRISTGSKLLLVLSVLL